MISWRRYRTRQGSAKTEKIHSPLPHYALCRAVVPHMRER
jgi:hypothetical protein